MRLTRRAWLSLSVGGPVALALRTRPATAQESGAADRIRRVILAYEQQGFHRTGTEVDQRSGDWLSEEVGRTGLTPSRSRFPLAEWT